MSYVIMNVNVLIVPNLTRDPRFANSPQVTGKPHFRFYAGAPIIIHGGLRIGSVCLMDYHPHPNFTVNEANFLIDLAAIVVDELELHRNFVDSDRRLDVAEADLIVARQAKKRFLSIISHELKTPLNSVLGFSQMIAQEQLGPIEESSYVEYAQHVYKSGQRLKGLIDRVLAYSSAEAGDLKLSESIISVRSLYQ